MRTLRLGWVAVLLFGAMLHGEELCFRWATEVSQAEAYQAQAMQGETFGLEATLKQYGAALTGDATATFYYQTKTMETTQWYRADATWDSETGTARVTWTPAMDVGATAYRWYFGIETAQGKNYRAFGTLKLKSSPGFSPAVLEAEDVTARITAELYAALMADLEGAFATADAITKAVNEEAAERQTADAALSAAVEQCLTEESDPTVPSWAKAASKPSYTAEEVGAAVADHDHDGVYAPLTAVTVTEGEVTYQWVWDEDAGTFALKAVE